jgi:hypothetical protein
LLQTRGYYVPLGLLGNVLVNGVTNPRRLEATDLPPSTAREGNDCD